HRANWGDADLIEFGTKGTPEKVQVGDLPEAGKWVRLEVEAWKLGLRPGTKVTGIAFTQFDGNTYWDKAGLLSVTDPAENPDLTLATWKRDERALGDKSNAPQNIKELLKKGSEKLEDSEREKLREYFLESVFAPTQLSAMRADMKSLKEKR